MAEDNSDKGFTVVDRRIKLDEEEKPIEGEGKGKQAGEEQELSGAQASAAAQEGPASAGPDPEDKGVGADECPEGPAERLSREEGSLPPVSFPTFLLSLHTSALIHLGFVPDPISRTCTVDIELARQNIDLLEILKEKTRGNLSAEEDKLLDNILYELRMAYIEAAGPNNKGEGQNESQA